jgi:hypothetical protein
MEDNLPFHGTYRNPIPKKGYLRKRERGRGVLGTSSRNGHRNGNLIQKEEGLK